MNFRRLSLETLDQVAAIEHAGGDTRWSRAQFEKELSLPMSRFFVLLQERDILGYGGFWKVGEEAQITNLTITPGQRRQGKGRMLLDQLLNEARREGCRSATLEVRGRNTPAQGLYQKAGFKLQGRRASAYSEPTDDAILMEKTL